MKTLLGELRRSLRVHQERYVTAYLRQTASEIPNEAAMVEDRRALGAAESIEMAETLFIDDFDT